MQKITLHPNMSPTFSLLYAIANEKTVVILMQSQIERLYPPPRLFPEKLVTITLVGIPKYLT